MGSIKRVSHLSRKAKRRLYCKLQLWMWRKRREKCCFGIFRSKRRTCRIRSGSGPCVNSKSHSQKNKRRFPMEQTLNHTTSDVPQHRCDTEDSENRLRGQNCQLKPCEPGSVSEVFIASSHLQNLVTDTDDAAGAISQTVLTATVLSQRTETFVQCCEIADASELSQTVTESDACGSITHFKVPGNVTPPQRLQVESPSGQHTVTTGRDQHPNMDTDDSITGKMSYQTDVSLTDLTKHINGMYTFIFLYPSLCLLV